jgi:hypothetical protein
MPAQPPFLVIPPLRSAVVPGAINLHASELTEDDIVSIVAYGNRSAQTTLAQLRAFFIGGNPVFLMATGDPDRDTPNLQLAFDAASANGVVLKLYGNFVVKWSDVIVYNFVNQVDRAVRIAVMINNSNLFVDGTNASISMVAPDFAYLDKDQFVVFGTDLSLDVRALSNVAFRGLTFNYKNPTTGNPLPGWTQGIHVVGVYGFLEDNCIHTTAPITNPEVTLSNDAGNILVTWEDNRFSFTDAGGQGGRSVIWLTQSDDSLPQTVVQGEEFYVRNRTANTFNISRIDNGPLVAMIGPDVTCAATGTWMSSARAVHMDNCDETFVMNSKYIYMRQGDFVLCGRNCFWWNNTFHSMGEGLDDDDGIDGGSMLGNSFTRMWGEAQPLDASYLRNFIFANNFGSEVRTVFQLYVKDVANGVWSFINKFKYTFVANLVAGTPGLVAAPGCQFRDGLRFWLEWKGATGTLPPGMAIYTTYVIDNSDAEAGTCNVRTPGTILTATVTNPGAGYTNITLTVQTSTGWFAQLTGHLVANALSSVTINVPGQLYDDVDTVVVTGNGTGAAVSITTGNSAPINFSASSSGGTLDLQVLAPVDEVLPSDNLVIADNLFTNLITTEADEPDPTEVGRRIFLLGVERALEPGQDRGQFRNGIPIQVQSCKMYNNVFEGGGCGFVYEGTNLDIDGMDFINSNPEPNSDKGAALFVTQAFTDDNAKAQSSLTGSIRNVRMTDAGGMGLVVRAPGDGFYVGDIDIDGYCGRLDDLSIFGFRIRNVELKPGVKTVGRVSVKGGLFGGAMTLPVQDIRIARTPGEPAGTIVNLVGPFTAKSTSVGALHFVSDIGPLVANRVSRTTPSIDTTGAGTPVNEPVFSNGANSALIMFGGLRNVLALAGNVTNFTTARLLRYRAGASAAVAGSINIDNAATITAGTLAQFVVSSLTQPNCTFLPGDILVIEYDNAAAGSVLPRMLFEAYWQIYSGP